MLTRLWHSCFPEFSSQQVWRHNFYLCQVSGLTCRRRQHEIHTSSSSIHTHAAKQWQLDQEVGILYLIYRWLSAILFLAVLSCSLLDIGRTDEPRYEHHYAKWWIYLTHWGLMACAVQAWLGAWIVTAGLMVDRDDYGGLFVCVWLRTHPFTTSVLFPVSAGMQRQMKKNIFHEAYWILYTIATVYSFIISICYWTVVHNPGITNRKPPFLRFYALHQYIVSPT